MKYFLMRKNEILGVVNIGEEGFKVISVEEDKKELLPLYARMDTSYNLMNWWYDRRISYSNRFQYDDNGVSCIINKSEYLLDNLGLSLNDYYWVKPIESDLTWEQVNLFSNSFNTKKGFMLLDDFEEGKYSPNASLLGNLPKYWIINRKGKRVLLKGNGKRSFSREAINEVIVSEFNRLQEYDNFVKYDLEETNEEYKYACSCENFVDEDNEFIPAISVINSERKVGDINTFEHFKANCINNGMDEEQLQYDLDYMFFMDFIVTNTDRHLNNFGVIRDAKTLKFKRLAPIFDSGNSFFVNRFIPNKIEQLGFVEINSFSHIEKFQLSYVKDKNVVDLSKIPSEDFLDTIYEKDSVMNEVYPQMKDAIINAFRMKMKIAETIQQGKKPEVFD